LRFEGHRLENSTHIFIITESDFWVCFSSRAPFEQGPQEGHRNRPTVLGELGRYLGKKVSRLSA